MKTIDLDESSLPEILGKLPTDKPITILNLRKFSETANYPIGSEIDKCTGSSSLHTTLLA